VWLEKQTTRTTRKNNFETKRKMTSNSNSNSSSGDKFNNNNGRIWESQELSRILARVHHMVTQVQNAGPNKNADALQDMVIEIEKHIGETVANTYDEFADRFADQLRKLKAKNAQLQRSNNDLKKKLRDALQEVNQLEGEKKQIEDRLNELQDMLANMKDMADQALIDENQRLKQRIKRLEHEKEAAENNARQLRSALEAKDNQLQDAARELAKLRQERDELLRLIRGWNGADAQALRDRVNQLEQEKETLEDRNSRLLRKLQDAQRNAEAEKDAKDGALEILKKAYTKVVNDEFNKAANSSQPVNAEAIEELRGWYKNQLREMNDRLHADQAHVMEEWEQNYERLQDSNEDFKEKVRNKEEAIANYNEQLRKAQETEAELRAQIAKYRILWNHFFGFDHPLQKNLERLHEQMDELESALNLPKAAGTDNNRSGDDIDEDSDDDDDDDDQKRDVLTISRLNLTRIPLKIGEVPVRPTDKCRFHLYNMLNRDIILRGFYLENTKGDRQPIPGDILPRSQRISCSVGRRDSRPGDMILAPHFTNFRFDDVIYLCDSYKKRVIVFPDETEDISDFSGIDMTNDEVDGNNNRDNNSRGNNNNNNNSGGSNNSSGSGNNGSGGNQISNTGPVLELTKIMSKDRLNPWTGFELTNCRGKPIRFLQCAFVVLSPAPRDDVLFQTRVPEFAIPATGVLRIVIGTNKVDANDIRIPPGVSFQSGTRMVMRDRQNKEILLYTQN
jgi:predicted  nucleic acid-binding Zn-ribbon protein